MLTDDNRRQFATDGYLVVRDVVPEALLAAADAEIDALVGIEAPEFGDGCLGWSSWSAPPRRLPACDQVLRRSRALAIAESLVAPHRLELHADEIQVTITVPPWPNEPDAGHVDGHLPEQNPPRTFTMLVGVFLSDQQTFGSGNLWVWPGSHLTHQRLCCEHGLEVLRHTNGNAALLDTLGALSSPVTVTAARGDIILAHFLVGHGSGGNMTVRDRRAVYYRLAVPGHRQWWDKTLLDVWFEYPDVRRAIGAPTS